MKIKFITAISFALFTIAIGTAQTERYQTRNGTIDFEASVPSFEKIEAINESTTVVLDANSGKIAALALVKGFHFPIALMEEHFNENYIESDDFPKATLRGDLFGFKYETLKSATSKTVTFNGTIELHGVKRPVSFPVDLSLRGDNIKLICSFDLDPIEFNIEIPKIVSGKIAETVRVKVQAILSKQL